LARAEWTHEEQGASDCRRSRHLGDSPRAAPDSFQSGAGVDRVPCRRRHLEQLWLSDVDRSDRDGNGLHLTDFATIDGVRAVVAASLDGEVYVVNAITGTALPGWPQKVDISASTPTAIESSPTVAYLDGPSQPPTIIVGAGSQSVPYQNGGVVAFYATGSVRFVFHTKDTFAQWSGAKNDNSVFATPAVGDIRGNGVQDIVFGFLRPLHLRLDPGGLARTGIPDTESRHDLVLSGPRGQLAHRTRRTSSWAATPQGSSPQAASRATAAG